MARRRPGDKPLSEPMLIPVHLDVYTSPNLSEFEYNKKSPLVCNGFISVHDSVNTNDSYDTFTQGCWDNMADISQTSLSKAFSCMEIIYFDSNFTEICSQGLKNNNPPLVEMIAWHRTIDKPLSEPMVA